MQFNKNHGGREKYHPTQLKKDAVNDCVIRAIAIALELDYMEVKRDISIKMATSINKHKLIQIQLIHIKSPVNAL